MVKSISIAGMAMIILPFLLLTYTGFATEKDKSERKHEFGISLGGGILPPLDIQEVNGSNLQRRYSWTSELGIGYAHKIYKGLSASVSIGVDVYSFRYAANVVIDAPRLEAHAIDIRRTQKFYCFNSTLSLLQQFILAEKLFSVAGGVKLIQTPSLLLGHGQTIQDSIGYTNRFFDSEVLLERKIIPVYILKFGTPLFKNTSKFWINIVYRYTPNALGAGTFYFANTTNNSNGTFNVRGSGMGIELRYAF